MKMLIAQGWKALIAVVLPLLFLTSCFEQSAVVKVKKDGSGIVHVRSYTNTAAAAGMFGGAPGAVPEDAGPELPSEEDLTAQAAEMGEGVTFESLTPGKNKSGWDGYDVIFAFEDINKLKLSMNVMGDMESMTGDLGDLAAETDTPVEEAADEEVMTFKMVDGLLEIRTPDPDMDDVAGGGGEDDPEGVEGGADNPFAGAAEDPQAMAMMGMMLKGARVGLFVEADGEIAESNAKHLNGTMATIMMMDLAKVMANAESMQKMEELSKADAPEDRESIQKLMDEIPGMTADVQDPITIKFK